MSSAVADWIAECAAASLNPPQVEATLRGLAEKWPPGARPLGSHVETFPLGTDALIHLLSVSTICASRIERQPALLLWLCEPEIAAGPRDLAQMARALHTPAAEPIASANFRRLREWKGREMVRIALREIAGVASLAETTAELSQIAEICLREVFRHWNAELRQKRGAPNAEFAILALGKLGGRELNHSSDIDVIFVYSDEGQLSPNVSYHQWFNLLAEKIIGTFSAADPAGSLFRIDVRLRPEGTAGPLARSLESMENYYAGFGETWERLALVKARGVAGSRELAYEFSRQLQPFIFPKTPSRDLLDEIAAIKRRIETDVVGHKKLGRDVKLGVGGIREIEFIAQALQLLHGARHAFLQETSTLRALPLLAELELLPPDEAGVLLHAYDFLRAVEHRLQIEGEQQTHTVPADRWALARLARSLGFASPDEFTRELNQQMRSVRAIFRRVIGATASDEARAATTMPAFRDAAASTKSLEQLAHSRSSFHVAPRTKQVFRRLQPLLLEQLAQVPDPDTALTQFVRFVESYGLRSLLFEMLATHPRLLELLVRTFDASRYAGDLLIRRPQLLEEVTRDDQLDRSRSVADHLRSLDKLGVAPESLDPVRAYRHAQTLRIFLRDVLGLIGTEELLREHSALAEACLIFVNQLRGNEEQLTIIALGKFGGSEIGYGADLDVLFVGDNVRAAQHLIVAMAQSTAEGAIHTVDARLRPDGEHGPLTCSVESAASYYLTRAQLWEIQALTKARAICGPRGREFVEIAHHIWRAAGERADLFGQLHAMFQRIRQNRVTTSDELDFKSGAGGLIAAEFVVQALQMRAGVWENSTVRAIEALASGGVLPGDEAQTLKRSYNYLRRVEAVLRSCENKSATSIPRNETAQSHLAARLNADSLDAFAAEYRDARNAIHAIYKRVFSDR